MSRALDLDVPITKAGFAEGDWVHTVKPIVIPWFGPGRSWCMRRGREVEVTTNHHQIEGELVLGGAWPMIRTTLLTKPHPLYRHKHPEQLVVELRGYRLESLLAHGTLVPCGQERLPRAISLEDAA